MCEYVFKLLRIYCLRTDLWKCSDYYGMAGYLVRSEPATKDIVPSRM